MKVFSFDDVLRVKDNNKGMNTISRNIESHYSPSQKIGKLGKKRAVVSKICLELNLRQTQENADDEKYKAILMAFNKVTSTTLEDTARALQLIRVHDIGMLGRITDALLKKTVNEPNFTDTYISLIKLLSPVWMAPWVDGLVVDFLELFILKLQELFEEKILTCDKNVGMNIMQVIRSVFERDLIGLAVIDHIIDDFLSKKDLLFIEYCIPLIKSPLYVRLDDRRNEIIRCMRLPARVTFMLEHDGQ